MKTSRSYWYSGPLAVDDTGAVYVTGRGRGLDANGQSPTRIPTTTNAFRKNTEDSCSRSVAKLDAADGHVVYATCGVGAGVIDQAGIAVAAGKIYVTGTTASTALDGTNPDLALQSSCQPSAGGFRQDDVFVAVLDPAMEGQQQLTFCTILGGVGAEAALAIAAEADGRRVYVTGTTAIPNGTTTPPAPPDDFPDRRHHRQRQTAPRGTDERRKWISGPDRHDQGGSGVARPQGIQGEGETLVVLRLAGHGHALLEQQTRLRVPALHAVRRPRKGQPQGQAPAVADLPSQLDALLEQVQPAGAPVVNTEQLPSNSKPRAQAPVSSDARSRRGGPWPLWPRRHRPAAPWRRR